jgi:hypothetical protein
VVPAAAVALLVLAASVACRQCSTHAQHQSPIKLVLQHHEWLSVVHQLRCSAVTGVSRARRSHTAVGVDTTCCTCQTCRVLPLLTAAWGLTALLDVLLLCTVHRQRLLCPHHGDLACTAASCPHVAVPVVSPDAKRIVPRIGSADNGCFTLESELRQAWRACRRACSSTTAPVRSADAESSLTSSWADDSYKNLHVFLISIFVLVQARRKAAADLSGAGW